MQVRSEFFKHPRATEGPNDREAWDNWRANQSYGRLTVNSMSDSGRVLIITAHKRSLREGNVFTLSVRQGGGGSRVLEF